MKLICSLRKIELKATPEELVRQTVLHELIRVLGYPSSLLVVEKEIQALPHLTPEERVRLPQRRADILCYGTHLHPKHPLYPLLLIECKAVKLTAKGINQVMGYNRFIKACFVAVVNQEERRLGWLDPSGEYQFIAHIPTYQELLASIASSK